jgi:hypothetical protein
LRELGNHLRARLIFLEDLLIPKSWFVYWPTKVATVCSPLGRRLFFTPKNAIILICQKPNKSWLLLILMP